MPTSRSIRRLTPVLCLSFASLFDVRVLELADPTKLFALDTSRVVGVAFDLLLSAGNTGNGQPLSGLTSLCHSPVCVDNFTFDDRLAVATIVIEVTHALPRHLGCSNESGKEMASCPYLGAEAVFRNVDLGRNRPCGC